MGPERKKASTILLILLLTGTLVLALNARTRAFQSVAELKGFENADRASLPLWASSDKTDERNSPSSNSEVGTQTDEPSGVGSPQRVEGFHSDLLEPRDSTLSSPLTAFSEDFEGPFPGDNWLVGDGNANNGLDYWDETSYRSQAGSWSGWCADIGSQTSTILSEDFEGVFPGSWVREDFDSGAGNDLWDDTSYRRYEGSWSAWCAEEGTKAVTTTIFYEGFEGAWPGSWIVYDDNEADGYDYWGDYSGKSYLGSWSGYCADEGAHPGGCGYDNNMDAYMYRNVSLFGYSSVSLSYYYWLDSESGYDYLYVAYFDGSWHDVDGHTGNSGGWQYSSVSIPTSAVFVGFHFSSDWIYCDYEGAFVDEVQLTGTSQVPNNSLHEYDNDMETYMYHSVGLSGYSSVSLSYYYWLDSESGYDYLYVAYFDGSWHDVDGHTGNSGGWQYSSVSIPTSAVFVGFHFSSDSSVCNYEGAYIDLVRLTGIISNPSLRTYDDYMDASMVRKYTIDASTWVSATLYYWAWYQTESSLDYCQVIVTDDAGSHWYYIGAQLSGSSGWSSHSLSIPGGYLTSLFNIGFKFHSDGSVHYEGVYLDSIILEYEPDITPPPAPVISSPTHTNEDDWFSNNDPGFEWTTPFDPSGIEGYSYILDHSPSTTPDETVDTTGNSASFLDIADDEWWFHVRAKDNANNWGAADHYRIRVDTTPPLTFIIHAPGSASVYLEAAEPSTPGSGVYAIYVRIDGGDWTEYLGAGPVEILLAGTEGHFIEAYSKDNANPRNSESPIKSLVVLFLTVNTNPPGLDDPTGEGWYDLGTVAYVNVDSVGGYVFEYWYLDGQVGTPYSLSMSTSIFMDDPHTLTARFRALVHDVAVTDVLPLKTVVHQGYLVSINVTVENQGDYTETFFVTVKYDLTLIETQIVTDLAPAANQTLTFNWNTTGVAPASYTMSAVADTVPGETDTVDNTYVDGLVLVAISGDVNLDGIVDIYDGVLVAAALGAGLITDPEDIRFGEYWHDEACSRCPHDPLADINQDGVIDSLDLEIVESNMGRTE